MESVILSAIPLVSTSEAVASLSITPLRESSMVPFFGILLFVLVLVLGVTILLVLRYVLAKPSKHLQHVPTRPQPLPLPIQLPRVEQSFSIDDFPIDDTAEKYLKEEEKIVYKILKSREGHCEQGTLQVITNSSKASLSRLLSEMETRGIIKKIKKGKKNIVCLNI